MEFKSLISSILGPHQHLTRKQIAILKGRIKHKLSQHGIDSCTYYFECSESSFHGYDDNSPIVNFQRHIKAKKAIKMIITAKSIELSDSVIQNFPIEFLVEIFKLLPRYQQIKLQTVFTQWNKIAPMLWNNVMKMNPIGKYDKLTNNNHTINSRIYLRAIRDSNAEIQMTINQFHDDELRIIFQYLPIDDKISCLHVCKRWQRVIKENPNNLKKFDVRTLSNQSRQLKCFNYGKYFEDVYCHYSYRFRPCKKDCPKLKNLMVDFGGGNQCHNRPSTFIDFLNFSGFLRKINEFRYLRKLMIKDASLFNYDLVHFLPSKLEELHIFDKPRENETMWGPDAPLTLSEFKHLRALTMVQSALSPEYRLSDNSMEILGFNNMSHLVYIRISGNISISNHQSVISLPLQYLSLTQMKISFENISSLMYYETIQYLDITDSFREMTKHQLSVMLSKLKQLRVFRISKTCTDRQHLRHTKAHVIPILPHLEILDAQYNHDLLNELILSVIRNSPNLKMVNMTVPDRNYLQELIAVAEHSRMKMNRNTMLNLFVGKKAFYRAKRLRLKLVNIQLAATPSDEYYKLVERLSWQDWRIDNGAVNINKICKDLIKSL